MHRETYNLNTACPVEAFVKFQPDYLAGVNSITRFDGDRLRVNADVHATSLLVPWQGAVADWQASTLADLTEAHFEAVAAMNPEVVIFGSGERLRFISPQLYRSLIRRGIGIETMDSGAACRTYNVLSSEGRRVVAAVLLHAPAGA